MNVFQSSLNQSARTKPSSEAEVALTPREREVLSYLASGSSNKDIADALGVQVVTIKLHVRGICRKLNVKNRTQAALRAGGLGILPSVC